MAELNKKYLPVFKSIPEVKLAYFFGSRATGDDGPASDYDFAVYLDEHDAKKIFDVKCRLLDKLGRLLKTDNLDLVVLDSAEGSELKYEIIKNGRLIYEQEPYRVLSKYNLTKA